MSEFVVKFNTDNDAFDGEMGLMEIAHLLSEVIEDLDYYDCGVIRDTNGNTIGYWRWEK